MVEELKRTRAQIKSAMTRFRKKVDEFNDQNNIRDLQQRLIDAKKLLDQFNEVQLKIEVISNIEEELECREEFENKYYETVANAEELIDKFLLKRTPISNNTNPSQLANQDNLHVNANIAVQLPVINLPKFSGLYTEWTAFYDSFESLIHDKNNLSNIQKFHYLKGCLSEDAKRLIDALPVSADNYEQAWSLLIERYKNKRLIVQHHIHSLFNLQPMNKSRGSLRELLDGLNSNLAALKSQNVETNSWDALLIYLLATKFDYGTKREWESTLKSNELPTLDQMITFLKHKCLTLESIECNPLNNINTMNKASTSQNAMRPVNIDTSFRQNKHFVVNNQFSCIFCKQRHYLAQCNDFLKLNVSDRIDEVRKHKLCYNCLKGGHDNKVCRASTCRYCANKHHTLLHYTNARPTNGFQSQNMQTSVTQCQLNSDIDVILSTAIIECYDIDGNLHKSRALLDPGSQQHLITEDLCKKLNLDVKAVQVGITGIGNTLTKINNSCELKIKSSYSSYNKNINCLVVPIVNNNFPLETFGKTEIPIPDNIHIADPNFNVSARIDLLIGAGLFWDLLEDGRIQSANGKTTIQNTRLGWILGGPFTAAAIHVNAFCYNINSTSHSAVNTELEKQIEKFWEIENYNNSAVILTEDDQFCEQLFEDTYTRDSNGKFIVRVPFKTKIPNIGSTKQIALRRFKSLENKFNKDPIFKIEYCKFMEDYITLNHMQLVDSTDKFEEVGFLPHHGVVKESSLTTKVRAVFDASCKSSSGSSLNDNLLAGPNLQTELFALLVKFRIHQFVLSADIVKMFRQIWIAEDDWKYQKILWRSNRDNPIETYYLKTVSYGTVCAPYLAMKCLRQLGLNAVNSFPEASRAITEDFYMDDLLTGANTLQEAVLLRNNIITILKDGGFELAKWASNNLELLPSNENENINTTVVRLDTNMQTKTLGLSWDCANDFLKYDIQFKNIPCKITKRVVLSIIATIYDPIGLLGPVLILAKLILQKLWQQKCDWDDKLPIDLQKKFEYFLSELPNINDIEIPRKIIKNYPYQKIELHGFSDASSQAYGAVLYIRTTFNTNEPHTINLVCAKGRIAPIKQISLPRLELCAALLLAKLISKVKKVLNINIDNCFLWCDSTITLAWIASSPNRWQTFVSNRVSEIQSLTEGCQWRHIKSNENPADIISRGVNPQELKTSQLWWNGPPFLAKDVEYWPTNILNKQIHVPEERKISLTIIKLTNNSWLFNKFSTYKKLKRVVAYCVRFYNICSKNSKTKSGMLTVDELEETHTRIIKLVQSEKFSCDIQSIKSQKKLNNNSPLLSLNVFLDSNDILRVGGRLQNSNLSFETKHPILLPKSHVLTKLIIRDTHIKELHGGAQATLAAVRRTYWPIAGRSTVNEIIHKCIKCYRTQPKPFEEIMGNLPADRVTPARPFLKCGVDYAGPLIVKLERGRSKRTIKSYVVVFVCLATKAIHLELVFDCTAVSFLNALKRMMARRGKVSHLLSDNGTNFVGANHELQKIKDLFQTKEFKSTVLEHLIDEGIQWKFIPPRSPYVGGIWEAGVKSFKKHFKKVTGSLLITIEEMYTLLSLIESCLNSRPLIPISNDPNDLEALTPGHFLIGSAITAPLEPNLEHLQENRLSRWQRIEKLRQLFWDRWHKEYLLELQRRNKWQRPADIPINVGSMVVLRDENLPPLQWKLGRVTELHPGADSIVRVVTIKTASATTKRGVNRLCVLPLDSDRDTNESDSASV